MRIIFSKPIHYSLLCQKTIKTLFPLRSELSSLNKKLNLNLFYAESFSLFLFTKGNFNNISDIKMKLKTLETKLSTIHLLHANRWYLI